MSLRLSAAFGTNPSFWLDMQSNYDMWQARRRKRPRIRPLELAAEHPKLSQLAKLVGCKAGGPDNVTHGESVHGIVARDGYDSDSIGHDDVTRLPADLKPGLLKCSDGLQMVHARNLCHGRLFSLFDQERLAASQQEGTAILLGPIPGRLTWNLNR